MSLAKRYKIYFWWRDTANQPYMQSVSRKHNFKAEWGKRFFQVHRTGDRKMPTDPRTPGAFLIRHPKGFWNGPKQERKRAKGTTMCEWQSDSPSYSEVYRDLCVQLAIMGFATRVSGRFARWPIRPKTFRPISESIRPKKKSIRPDQESIRPD